MPDLDLGRDTESDQYADYQVQSVIVDLQSAAAASGNVGDLVEFPVLAGSQQLGNDEVAELVYSEVLVQIQDDDHQTSTNSGPGSARAEWVWGSNLTIDDLPDKGPVKVQDTDAEFANGITSTDFTLGADYVNDPGVFGQYSVSLNGVFEDAVNGLAGGGGSGSNVFAKRSWRELFGRGPVLDATDEISVLGNLNLSGEINEVLSECRMQLIWDVAEVEGVRGRFSMPR